MFHDIFTFGFENTESLRKPSMVWFTVEPCICDTSIQVVSFAAVFWIFLRDIQKTAAKETTIQGTQNLVPEKCSY